MESRLQPALSPWTFRRLKAGLQHRVSRSAFALVSLLLITSGCPTSKPGQPESGSTTAQSRRTDELSPSPALNPSDSPATTAPLESVAPTANVAVTDQQPAAIAPVDAATEIPPAPGDPAPVHSTAWPNFRNGSDLRGIAGTTLPENLELLWKLETHDGVTSTAAIAEGRVYVAELSGNIRCLDLRSGQEYWHYRTIENEDPEEFAPGFNAPVTLSATAVFVGDEEGTLHAVERESGRLLWKFDSEGEIKGGATLLPPDPATGAPRVMFGSHDGKLYCLNAATGEQSWAFDTLGPVNGSQALTPDSSSGGNHGVNGTPAVTGQFTFVAGCDKPFLRVVDVASGQQHAEIPLESLLIASPALIGNVLYFGTPDGEVIALDWTTHKQEWLYSDTQRQQEIHSSPAVTDALVLIGSRDKRLHAIDRLTGKAAWTFETRGPIDSSPVVVGERIFFGSADRHVYGIDFAGNEVWKYNSGRRISASPAVGDGHLIIGCEGPDGPVLCFGAMQ